MLIFLAALAASVIISKSGKNEDAGAAESEASLPDDSELFMEQVSFDSLDFLNAGMGERMYGRPLNPKEGYPEETGRGRSTEGGDTALKTHEGASPEYASSGNTAFEGTVSEGAADEDAAGNYSDSDITADSSILMDDDMDQDEISSVSGDVIELEAAMEEDPRQKVFLTFDDGPSVYTDRILRILSENEVHATFFVCGTGDFSPGLVNMYSRIVREGHTIGMHSYSHVYSQVYSSLQGFEEDLEKIRDLIYNETGIMSNIYRFPGGSANTVADVDIDECIDILEGRGIEYYDWNVTIGDERGKVLSSQAIVRNVVNGVGDKKAAIVLLHDTGREGRTVEALPGIIRELKERDAAFLTISRNTPPLHQYSRQGDFGGT